MRTSRGAFGGIESAPVDAFGMVGGSNTDSILRQRGGLPRTVVDALISRRADRERGYTFVGDDGTERLCSFAELHQRAAARASHLRGVGLCAGDRVVVIVADPEEFVVTFFAALYAGVLPVPLPAPHALDRLDAYWAENARTIRAAKAAGLVCPDRMRSGLCVLAGHDPEDHRIVAVESFRADARPGDPATPRADDGAFVQFMSDVRATPDAVVLRHGDLIANSQALQSVAAIDPKQDTCVSWLPLHHESGLMVSVVLPLVVGLSSVIARRQMLRNPAAWLELIDRHRASFIVAPNFAYALSTHNVAQVDLDGLDLTCVRSACCGAGTLSAEVMAKFAACVGLGVEAMIPFFARRYARDGRSVQRTGPGPVQGALVVRLCAGRKQRREGRRSATVLELFPGAAQPISD